MDRDDQSLLSNLVSLLKSARERGWLAKRFPEGFKRLEVHPDENAEHTRSILCAPVGVMSVAVPLSMNDYDESVCIDAAGAAAEDEEMLRSELSQHGALLNAQ